MRKFGIVVLSILLLNTVAKAQKFNLDKIVAVVGNSVILASDIETVRAQYLTQGINPNKCLLAQSLITQKLLVQQAAIDSIEVKDDEVADEVDRRMRRSIQMAGSEEKLAQFLNRPILQYKDEIVPDVKEMLLAQKMQQKITEKLNTTPQDVIDYYNRIPKDSLPTFSKEVEVAQIVFEPKLTTAEKEPFRLKAQELLDRVKKGEDFSVLATAYSQDPGSASQGGDMGFADRNTFVKEFTAWAFKLKVNEYSPVFETEYGFHFLQVMERRGEQVHVRHILITPIITPASLERAKGKADTVYNLLDKNRKVDFFASAASYYSDDKDTKYNGGLLMNQDNVETRSTYIPIDKLDPQVALIIDTMKVGGISKPQIFTDKMGKKSYRIYYLKSVTDAHKANLAQDLPKLKILATQEKTNRVISQWFAKKRKETYIKIDPEYQACPTLKDWPTDVSTAALLKP